MVENSGVRISTVSRVNRKGLAEFLTLLMRARQVSAFLEKSPIASKKSVWGGKSWALRAKEPDWEEGAKWRWGRGGSLVFRQSGRRSSTVFSGSLRLYSVVLIVVRKLPWCPPTIVSRPVFCSGSCQNKSGKTGMALVCCW